MTGVYEAWIGRSESAEDAMSPAAARRLLATLDPVAALPAEELQVGAMLPPLWHWALFLPDVPMSGLGPDGHPARGGFLPPVPLERRMWAGGRLEFRAPLRIGAPVRRRSEILRIADKSGGAGRMVFVTIRHDLEGPEGPAVREEQDIVYLAMPERYVAPASPRAPAEPEWDEAVQVDPARLFRYSAVTFNAHRIHYDRPYATEVEKYPALVVHGPLQAQLLLEAARRHRGGALPRQFRFRGLRPLFDGDGLRLIGEPAAADGTQALCTATRDGAQTMAAQVVW